MATAKREPRRTRREFLGDIARLGLGAAALATFGPQAAQTALAQGTPRERVKVLIADLVESSAADFARGRAQGVAVVTEGGHAALRGSGNGEFTSGVVALPFAATHLGLHWVARGNSPTDLAVDVRTSVDGATWSSWQPLTLEAVADQGAPQEMFAALTGTDRAKFAQYRVTFRSSQATTLTSMTVTAINSVDGPREALPAGTATTVTLIAPAGNSIAVVTREGWGCDESLRFHNRTELWPEMYVPAKKVVLHHTATSNSYTDGAAEVRAIYAYHARTLRWGDIGYNSLIDRFGTIYEGRHGRGESSSREILSADVVAGHVYSHNYGSTGFAAIGDYDQGTPTDVLLKSIDDVATFECDRHFINPSIATDFLRSDDVWHSTMNNISGHYESYNTSCPGANLRSYLPTLRSHVASRLNGNPAPILTESNHSASTLTAPVTLSFSWSTQDPGPYQYCFEGWYKPSNSYDINYLQGYALDSQYNDPLAQRQLWTGTNATSSPPFQITQAGHYTMHVRSASGRYEANLTYLVGGGTSTKPHGKR